MQLAQKHCGTCQTPSVQELHTSEAPSTVFLNTTTNASSIFLFCSNLLLYWTGNLPSLYSPFSVSAHLILCHFVSTACYLTHFFLPYPFLCSLKYILFLRLYSSFSFVWPFFFENLFILIFLSAS